MSLDEAISTAIGGSEVPAPMLEKAFETIMRGEASPVQMTALLVALRTKGETAREISAAARALRAQASPLPAVDPRTVDTCGTGGDGANTFNISTAVAFVVAGAGVPVAKHGNRAASSQSGSFDVLEELGVRIDLPLVEYVSILAEVGIAPFFARSAHPAMRHVAPIRQELGLRTIMNCLGPLLNPVGARFQLVGVYDAQLVETLAIALGELGAERAVVVHGSDGLDELTTTGPSTAALLENGKVELSEIDPAEFGIARTTGESLAGGTPAENAGILRAILDGEAGPRREIVVLNAAAALWAAGAADSLQTGLAPARDSIDSGAAKRRLEALAAASQRSAD